ncbi:phage tail-like protein [Bradyrhizobium sp. AZCC 1588]|uniref:phage tail protein n=1 Tax=unclassified Bradyrhizobium TaxID=2631580 RepID=UPI002FF0F8A6
MRPDPLRNFRFRVDIAGIAQIGFNEAALAETTTDVIEDRVGTDPTHVMKLSGLTKYGNVTLKFGVTTDSKKLFDWHKAILDGQIQKNRKTVTITVQDETGADKARFVVNRAWPMKYDPSDLNGKGNEVFIETLELCNEGVERVA